MHLHLHLHFKLGHAGSPVRPVKQIELGICAERRARIDNPATEQRGWREFSPSQPDTLRELFVPIADVNKNS